MSSEKKMISVPDSYLFHITSTINRLILIVCGFNLVVALIEAHFWHLTEPSTLGFKLWPVLITIVAFCVPGIILAVKQVRTLALPIEAQLPISMLCPLLLALAASPVFYENAPARTIILSTGTFILPFIVFWCWSPCQKGLSGEVFLAVFITMSIRLTANSVNIFYESWATSTAFFLICLLSAALHYIMYRNLSSSGATTRSNELCDGDVETSVDDTTVDVTMNDINTISNPVENEASQPPSGCKEQEDAAVNPVILISVLLLLIPGLASSVMLFIQYFTSPTLFVRWAGFAASPLRILILMISLMNALACAGSFTQITVLGKKNNENASCSENNAAIIFITVNCTAVLIIGTVLFTSTFSVGIFAMVGACSICFALPFTFTRILDSFLLLQHHVSRTHPCFPGLSLLIGGVFFFGIHMLVVCFSLSTLTAVFIGRMDVILLVQMVLVCTSLIAGKVLVSRKALTSPYENSLSDRVFMTQCITRWVILLVTIVVTGVLAALTNSVHTCEHMHQIEPNTYYCATAMPNSSDASTIRVMSWNVLLGHTLSGRDNSACVSRAIQYFGPQLVALQESEPLPAFFGGKDFLGSCQYQLSGYGYKALQGVPPIKSTIGVGLLSKLELIEHKAHLLPVETPTRVPNYAYTKTSFKVPNSTQRLYVITAHAVYTNWTVGNLTALSTSHIQLLANESSDGPRPNDPVIVMGDLNVNPDEAQLDLLWNNANLSCAINNNRQYRAQSTTLDMYTNIDHIFYRNLKLLAPGKILAEVGPISDHLPVMADFEFLPDSSG